MGPSNQFEPSIDRSEFDRVNFDCTYILSKIWVIFFYLDILTGNILKP